MTRNDNNTKGTKMNATLNHQWTKTGDWTPASGPWYRHESGRVAVSGHYGTVGDNMRGWRKTRFYDVLLIGEGGKVTYGRSCRTAKVAKEAALKLLAAN
jgi:hypothetical protein